MSTKPDRVELFEQGILKLVLTDSDKGSLNNRKDRKTGKVYTGRATSAKIFGPKGAKVTFYDNKGFQTNENSLSITKLTDDPIEVFLAKNFVQTTERMPDGMFVDEEPGKYKWELYKHVKRSSFQKFLEDTGLDDWLDRMKKEAKESGHPHARIGATGIAIFVEEGGPTSNNYRVDNVSSVEFGG